MVIALRHRRMQAAEQGPEPPAVLTPRGRAAARLLAFEDVWAELVPRDRAYFATELEQLAREARVDRIEA